MPSRTVKTEAKSRLTKSRPPAAADKFLLSYRDRDTDFGVSRTTVQALTQHLGLTETQLIHRALAEFVRSTLPRYEQDDGPIADDVFAAIKKKIPQGRMRVSEDLLAP